MMTAMIQPMIPPIEAARIIPQVVMSSMPALPPLPFFRGQNPEDVADPKTENEPKQNPFDDLPIG